MAQTETVISQSPTPRTSRRNTLFLITGIGTMMLVWSLVLPILGIIYLVRLFSSAPL
jgi:hypothetical protein